MKKLLLLTAFALLAACQATIQHGGSDAQATQTSTPVDTITQVSELPVPMPTQHAHLMDFDPMPVWEFYDEFRINPAAAYVKYHGKLVMLAYARIPAADKDGYFQYDSVAPITALQAEGGMDQDSLMDTDPVLGRDFQIACPHIALDRSDMYSNKNRGGTPFYLWDNDIPYNPPYRPDHVLRMVKAARGDSYDRYTIRDWNNTVYALQGRVLGFHPIEGRRSTADGKTIKGRYVIVELDECALYIMEGLTSLELDAWFNAYGATLPPGTASFRPSTAEDLLYGLLPAVPVEPKALAYHDPDRNSRFSSNIEYRDGGPIVGKAHNQGETWLMMADSKSTPLWGPLTDFELNPQAPPLPTVDADWWDNPRNSLDYLDAVRACRLGLRTEQCPKQD